MKTQEKTIKVYYGLKWVEFKPITKEKYHRLKENSRLCFVKNAITYYECDSEDKGFYVLLDKNNDDYDVIYFCVPQERYIVYTDRNVYEFERGDTVAVYLNGKHGEFYIEDVFIGLEISVCFDDDYEIIRP